jgi:hypothetical protein
MAIRHVGAGWTADYAGACHRAALCANPLGSNPPYELKRGTTGLERCSDRPFTGIIGLNGCTEASCEN